MRSPDLSPQQRIEVAQVSGAVQRLGFGKHAGIPHQRKITELRGCSTDPAVYGTVLGHIRATAEELSAGYLRCEPLLLEMGADETVARQVLDWRRDRRRRRQAHPEVPIL